jgi:hypothetical protein
VIPQSMTGGQRPVTEEDVRRIVKEELEKQQ